MPQFLLHELGHLRIVEGPDVGLVHLPELLLGRREVSLLAGVVRRRYPAETEEVVGRDLFAPSRLFSGGGLFLLEDAPEPHPALMWRRRGFLRGWNVLLVRRRVVVRLVAVLTVLTVLFVVLLLLLVLIFLVVLVPILSVLFVVVVFASLIIVMVIVVGLLVVVVVSIDSVPLAGIGKAGHGILPVGRRCVGVAVAVVPLLDLGRLGLARSAGQHALYSYE